MNVLEHWDRKLAPYLESIEANASWIEHYAGSVKEHAARLEYAIRRLQERPPFETKARDQLTGAVATLNVTLALCRSAMEAYDAKPVTIVETE